MLYLKHLISNDFQFIFDLFKIMSKYLSIVQNCLKNRGPLLTGIQGKILPRTDVISASPQAMKVSYRIDPDFDCNPIGNMHGGIIASLIDSTTVVNGMLEPRHLAGASADLSVQYLNACNVHKHEKVICESKIEKVFEKMLYFEN